MVALLLQRPSLVPFWLLQRVCSVMAKPGAPSSHLVVLGTGGTPGDAGGEERAVACPCHPAVPDPTGAPPGASVVVTALPRAQRITNPSEHVSPGLGSTLLSHWLHEDLNLPLSAAAPAPPPGLKEPSLTHGPLWARGGVTPAGPGRAELTAFSPEVHL